MVTPAAHREAAAYVQQTYEMSQRRACRVIDGDRASVRYQARRPDDGELRERLVGKQALELEFLKGAVKSAPRPKGWTTSVVVGPRASASQKDAG